MRGALEDRGRQGEEPGSGAAALVRPNGKVRDRREAPSPTR